MSQKAPNCLCTPNISRVAKTPKQFKEVQKDPRIPLKVLTRVYKAMKYWIKLSMCEWVSMWVCEIQVYWAAYAAKKHRPKFPFSTNHFKSKFFTKDLIDQKFVWNKSIFGPKVYGTKTYWTKILRLY